MPESTGLRSRGLQATLPHLQILEIFQKTKMRHLSADAQNSMRTPTLRCMKYDKENT
ncbi:hypothetical protein [Nitrosomonas sp. HPC101]|uniref:hypothetical protein n=1 Tax=Nitrosomonas sp. HPC101 TaxID=1658667 RepID=UPI0018778D0F|nr:hypothetical protein [Nitrosomonas sp. HPC101]